MKTKITLALIAILGVGVATWLCLDRTPKTKLYIYTWADYIDPDLVGEFEKENSCEVVIDTFDSNESMYAKLKAGAIGYDIITPTEYIMPQLVEANLLEAMDLTMLSNVVENLDPLFKTKWTLEWNVPYCFSCTGILWRKDKVPSDLTFLDWSELFDDRLKGRICIMDDIRELIGLGLKMNKCSVNTVDPVEIDRAADLAKRWKGKAAKMDNEAYRIGVPSGEFSAAMAYNSDAIMLLAADGGEAFGYVVPTNGTISSMDVMCVLKTSRNKELAFKFMNMLYEKDNAVSNSEYNGAPMPIKGLYEALSDKYKAIPLMNITKEFKSRCEDIEDVGEALEIYSKAWDKVKSEN